MRNVQPHYNSHPEATYDTLNGDACIGSATKYTSKPSAADSLLAIRIPTSAGTVAVRLSELFDTSG